jgi:hypothetical protein
VRRIGPPGAAGISAKRGHVPFGLKEGRASCTNSNGLRSEEERRQEQGKILEQLLASATPECESVSAKNTLPHPLIPYAMELSSAEFCPTRRGWTFCPAGARPFWIKRGECPLHDLEGVEKRGRSKPRQYRDQNVIRYCDILRG